MLRGTEGRSIIPLILGVIILVVIIGIGAYFLLGEVSKKDLEDINTNMLLVQAKAKIIQERNHINKDENPLKGEKLEDGSLGEQFGIEDITKYYKWNQDVVVEAGLKEITLKGEEYYAVNYETLEIIYSKGYTTKENITYYKLSDIKKILNEEEM